MTIRLKLVGPYGPDGWEDPETGEQFFNSEYQTPHGILGKLKTHFDDEVGLVIDQADPIVLINNDLSSWTASAAGATIKTNPYGVQTFELIASNGAVLYQLINQELELADGEPMGNMRIGMLMIHNWTPVGPKPEATRREVTTKELKLVDPADIPPDAKGIRL